MVRSRIYSTKGKHLLAIIDESDNYIKIQIEKTVETMLAIGIVADFNSFYVSNVVDCYFRYKEVTSSIQDFT